jgi:hypothetical protein
MWGVEMRTGKALSVLVALALVLTPFFGLIAISPNVAAAGDEEITLTTTKEGWSSLDFVWDTTNIGNPFLMNLSLNKGWSIEDASVGVSGSPVVTDEGTEWETWDYPERPRLDVGRNGDDWEFPGLLGYQNMFANESDAEELTFSSNDEQPIYVPLPVGATVKNINYDINNTQSGQFEYKMYIGNSNKRVWYKSSIGFSKGPTIETEPYGITSVCIDHLDFLFDSYNDIIGVGDGGSMYIVMHSNDPLDEETGYKAPFHRQIGMGEPLPAILDCAVGDYDQDIDADIALSSADGKMYVLTNEGFGSFSDPEKIETETVKSRMETIAIGDVNNDGWGDIVGGYLRGQFFISEYDNNKGGFKAPVEIDGGTGAMNAVYIGDMDLDALNDLVGANNDRRWWYVKNYKGTGWLDAVPIYSGGSDLTSLAVVDVNWDNSPDMISGSQDGSFYVSYNLGGTFDEGVSLRGGLESMKQVVAGDLDLDGDIDILGLNSDGYIYLVKNEFGFLKDGEQLMEVGKSVNSIALGDLDNDNDLDLVAGNNKGFVIYWNNLGPFAVTLGQTDGGLLKGQVQNFLDFFHPDEEDYDQYGNLIVDVPFNIMSTYPGSLVFEYVNITYTYEATVDITTALNLYIKANSERADSQGLIDVPVQFLTDSPGRLHITNLTITYTENLMALIDSPVDQAEFNTTQSVTLKGHCNEDPMGNLEGFEYTWMVDGRLLGNGATLKVTGEDLGGVGSHTIRFSVKEMATRQTASAQILINLQPPKAPFLTLKINLLRDATYIEDERVDVEIKITNTGVVNASRTDVILKDGNRNVGSKTVDIVPVGEAVTITIPWIPVAGDHKLTVEIVSTQPYKGSTVQVFVVEKPTDYTIFAIILILIIVLGVAGYFGIRYKQRLDEYRAKKEREKMEKKLKEQMAQDFADLYTVTGADPYATYGEDAGYAGYDTYGTDTTGYAAYGDTSVDYMSYKCPRCGNPTTEHGVQCFSCDARDSVNFAEEAIREVKELGIDVDEAEDLLKASRHSLNAGDYEVALEEAEEAEDIANEVKERYEKAFALISTEATESAAERRRKRLERRRAAREKKEKEDAMKGGEEGQSDGAEGAEGPQGGE